MLSIGLIICFMVFAAIFGYIGDKNLIDRRLFMVYAVLFWSFATGLAAVSVNLVQLIVFRSLVGIGEAAYGTIAPPMLFDFFPTYERTVSYGVYYAGVPVGTAVGFGLGAVVASLFGWR